MTTTQPKRKTFIEERPPREITYKKEADKITASISGFNSSLFAIQAVLIIAFLAGGYGIFTGHINVFIYLPLLSLPIIWLIYNLKAKMELSITEETIEFHYGTFNNSKLIFNKQDIAQAKIESTIIGGESFGGIGGMSSRTTKIRNLILENKNGKQTYIPLESDICKRYFAFIINKYKN